MTRGHRGVPYKVRALASNGATVLVDGGEETRSIGYPASDVFEFDDRLFSRILAASADVRDALWEKAVAFDANQLPPII
jgi:hypothetical protein